jgi:hypothetical protein
MNPENIVTPDFEFVLRRTQEALPNLALFLPVVFTLLVLLLLRLVLREHISRGLLAALFLPFVFSALAFLVLVLLRLFLPEHISGSQLLASLVGLVVTGGVLSGLVGLILLLLRMRHGLAWASLVVAGVFAVYLLVAFPFKEAFSWWVILVPFLLVGLIYVILMYYCDTQTIHPAWAMFLGLLRCTVYAILAFVFLLPGCQYYDTTETRSKVLFLFDVSGSMVGVVDDLPRPGEDPALLPTRQDKVIRFLTNTAGRGKQNQLAFLDRVLEKSPVTAYRFGTVADDVNVQHFHPGQRWTTKQEWAAWLKPDKAKIVVPADLPAVEQVKLRARLNDLHDDLVNGTNVSGSALQAAKLEAGSLVQALVLFSDGQSNQGNDAAIKEFLERVGNQKRPIHVFTVGVGEFRQPVSIRVESLQAPGQARPDDKFPVRVPVFGAGLQDEEFTVVLEATRVEDAEGRPVGGEKPYALTRKGKFKGGGENPNDEVEFEIDVQDLKGIKAENDAKGELEGTWQFVAKVPRHPREAFPKAEHVSDPPTRVLVQKRKLRVLLFAGGPSREYQFVRALFYREVLEKRMDLAIYLQTGREDNVDQDVESEWLLTHFPDKVGPDDPRDKHSSLNEYDAIIAFDPDWEALEPAQMRLLKDWVGTHAGGLIFVAGPVHTYFLARGSNPDLAPLITLVPVVLKDSRLVGLNIGHDPTRPYALNFAKNAAVYDFIKLDEEAAEPFEPWDRFFWAGPRPEGSKETRPQRGFYNYYPVEKVKPASSVLATFAGPAASRLPDGSEQPFLVSMPYGNGKTFYLGSGELWRLRQFKESFYERFWIKLARYAASGGLSRLSKYGHLLVARQATTGVVPVEAQILGEDMKPLARDARPVVKVKRPADFNAELDKETPKEFELRPKNTQGEWNGWFTGTFRVRTPGVYELSVPIPGTSQALTTNPLEIRKPNLERDNVRPNFGSLYQLASPADKALSGMNPAFRGEVLRALQPPSTDDLRDASKDLRSGARLFFTLQNADLIPDCLVKVEPKRESIKSRYQDLWDRGVTSDYEMRADHVIIVVVAAFGLVAFGVLAFIRRFGLAVAVLGGTLAVIAGVFVVTQALKVDWAVLPLDMSFVLGVIVGLLSLEWLTRKLLKLA